MESLFQLLKEKNLTLGTIESMTGGLFASKFTEISGVSKVFKGAIITYSTLIKENVVGVDDLCIDKFGVVSSEVAKEMAEKGKKLLGVDVCISITGNAGPTCEPGNKPVGCFYVAVAVNNESFIKEFNEVGNRNEIRNKAILAMRDFAYSKIK